MARRKFHRTHRLFTFGQQFCLLHSPLAFGQYLLNSWLQLAFNIPSLPSCFCLSRKYCFNILCFGRDEPVFLGHDREDHRYGLNRSCFASGRVRCVNSLNTVHLLPARASFKARFTGRSPRKYAHLSSLAVSLLYWLGGLTGLPRSWDTTLIHLN